MHKEERIFRFKEHLTLLNEGIKGLVYAKRNKKRRLVTKQFKERLMLAVTEVNGCTMCSYVHTKLSLSAGMDIAEIRKILNGDLDDISNEEMIGVLFAQHYADSKENPSEETVERLNDYYGNDRAVMIVHLLKVITLTNSLGINFNLMKERLLFKRNKQSSFLNEFGIILSTFLFGPILLLWNIVSGTGKKTRKLVESL